MTLQYTLIQMQGQYRTRIRIKAQILHYNF